MSFKKWFYVQFEHQISLEVHCIPVYLLPVFEGYLHNKQMKKLRFNHKLNSKLLS